MAAALVPDTLWGLIEPLLPTSLPKPARWPTPSMRPGLSQRHSVRTPKWHRLADDAERTGLRLRHDLLAAFTRLAARRNLGLDPLRFAELAFT
jgi:hypothetical protein